MSYSFFPTVFEIIDWIIGYCPYFATLDQEKFYSTIYGVMTRKPFIKIDNYGRGGKFRIDLTEEIQLNKLEREGLKFPERKSVVKLANGNQFPVRNQQSTLESKQTAKTDLNHVAGEFVELTSAESIQEAYNNIHSMEFLIPSSAAEKSDLSNNIDDISNEICVQVNNPRPTITTSMDINNVLVKSTKKFEIQIQNKTEQGKRRIEQQAAFKCKQCDFHAANTESIISHHIESHMEYM